MSAPTPGRLGMPITEVETAVRTFPTPQPEADGTLSWDSTTAVVVTLEAGGHSGVGWTYSSPVAAEIVSSHLAGEVKGMAAADICAGWEAMHRAGRNLGTRGLFMQALSAVDIAWWDLKARLLDLPLTALLGRTRDAVPIYGSGGFTTLTESQLADQVQWWQSAGCTAMKIKIGESWGTRPDRDLQRVEQLRELAGPGVDLMVDANGAYTTGQARRVGAALDDLGVTWFEEPVSSDDTEGLQTVRAALRCDIAAGEYAADLYDVRALLPVLDCLQLDATRCGATPAGSGPRHWRRLTISRFPRTARRPCMPRSRPPYRTCAMSNGSPTTRGWRINWSVGHPRLATVPCIPITTLPGTA